MASVEDIVECPQCGKKAFLKFQTRTLQEEIKCPICGYGESTRPVTDRKKQRQDPQHRAWFKRRKDGERILRTTRHAGFGSYNLAQSNGVGVLGAIKLKLTPKMIASFKREMTKPELDAQRCFLTRWNSMRNCIEVLIG